MSLETDMEELCSFYFPFYKNTITSDHNGYEKTILVYYDMTLYAFYFFVSVNPAQNNIIPQFDALAVHNTRICFYLLTPFYTDMPTQFL